MSFMYYEGTADFLAATPALTVTFEASGSITAGRAVSYDTAGQASTVYMPSAVRSGATVVAGVALQTVSTGNPVGVLVWGYAKSLPKLGEGGQFGESLVISGSGYWTQSGSGQSRYVAGRIVSGSGNTIVAFIDCMK